MPADKVVGWRAGCECGWLGPLWEGVSASELAEHDERLVYVPFHSVVTPSVACEDGKEEWAAHAVPASSVTEIEAASRAVRAAQGRLDRAVSRGRASGLTC